MDQEENSEHQENELEKEEEQEVKYREYTRAHITVVGQVEHGTTTIVHCISTDYCALRA